MRLHKIQWISWGLVSVTILSFSIRNADGFVLQRPIKVKVDSPLSPWTSTKATTTTHATRLRRHGHGNGNGSGLQSQSRPTQSRKKNTTGSRTKGDYRRKNDPLIPVLDSIIYYGQHYDQSTPSFQTTLSQDLIEALQRLKEARNQSQMQQAGQLLTPELLYQQPIPIQERLLKALALAGLMEPAMSLLQNMLHQQGYLPSYISYTAILTALRHEGRTEEMYHCLLQLNHVAQNQKKSIHVMAMNLYLAALCDHGSPQSLDDASQWILNPDRTDTIFGVPLDLTSYNTLLNGASKQGNQTLVDAIWKQLSLSSTLQPDIRSYNARLVASNTYSQRLEIGTEIVQQTNLLPDRYTIDLLLLPMLSEHQDQWEQLLDNFIATHTEDIVRDAFSAFLTTLVQNGKLEYARRLFDIYIVPKDTSQRNDTEHSSLQCRPHTRHYNILIDGYRRQAENALIAAASKAVSTQSGETSEDQGDGLLVAQHFTQQAQTARIQGRTLFVNMKNTGIPPDSYSLTSMMGLCETSSELVRLVTNPKWYNRISLAVIRSAITASGQLGDPGLACALFDRYASRDKFLETSPRLWNVLLGALAESAEKGNRVIDLDSNSTIMLLNNEKVSDVSDRTSLYSISRTLEGKPCTEAVRQVLHILGKKANAQSYCLAATALQYDPNTGPNLSMSLFRNATNYDIPADGRFINAIFRCFGDDIDQAIACWKSELRQACLVHESRPPEWASDMGKSPNRNLVAAYNGLIHVCGRAHRPDIGVRLVYAMNREGIEPNEVTLNNYRAGKRLRKHPAIRRLLSLPTMVSQYENILYVECTKYNQYNKRMSKDKRVRIIV